MKILTVILTLLITTNIFASQKSDLEVVFNEYLDATNKKDVDSQVAHLYPKQFQYYPKENVVKAFEMMKYVENLQFGNQKLISISEIYEEKNIKYALITFSLELLLDLSEFKNTERNNQPLNNMLDKLKESHGKENVVFNSELFRAEIQTINKLYAVFDPEFNKWQFIANGKGEKTILDNIIPKDIMLKLLKGEK